MRNRYWQKVSRYPQGEERRGSERSVTYSAKTPQITIHTIHLQKSQKTSPK